MTTPTGHQCVSSSSLPHYVPVDARIQREVSQKKPTGSQGRLILGNGALVRQSNISCYARANASDSRIGQRQSRMHRSLPGLQSVFTHANLCRTKARPLCRVHGICPVRSSLQPKLMSAHTPPLRPFWLQRISRRSRQRLPPGCKRHPYAAP